MEPPGLYSCRTGSVSAGAGLSLAWPLAALLGEDSSEERRGTSESEEGKRRGGCMFPPLPLPTRGASSHEGGESTAVQPQNKASDSLAVPSCAPASCVGNPTPQGPRTTPHREGNGWATPPQAKEELPKLI